ncbi:MAG: RHS repeat-associated core domain-containing protein [Candidatus Omnitrophica bacterium]|nr:RHS repeat-associated core domain-containing protein [Candidatus Omnitrophota bacterium]
MMEPGTLSYDYENHQTVYSTTGTSFTYKIDAMGRRISKTNNQQQTTKNCYIYGTFGDLIVNSEMVPQRYKFTGREYDSESSSLHYRDRQYRPTMGRFNRRDSIGYIAGINLYAYVRNNPVNRRDPYGLNGIDDLIDWGEFFNGLTDNEFIRDNAPMNAEPPSVIGTTAGNILFLWLYGQYVYGAGETVDLSGNAVIMKQIKDLDHVENLINSRIRNRVEAKLQNSVIANELKKCGSKKGVLLSGFTNITTAKSNWNLNLILSLQGFTIDWDAKCDFTHNCIHHNDMCTPSYAYSCDIELEGYDKYDFHLLGITRLEPWGWIGTDFDIIFKWNDSISGSMTSKGEFTRAQRTK